MARASEADIQAALDIARIIGDLEKGYTPVLDGDYGDDETFFNRDDPEQCKRLLAAILNAADKGSIFRVVFGMAVVLDPRNELLDPSADTIEKHPKIVAALEAQERARTTTEDGEWASSQMTNSSN